MISLSTAAGFLPHGFCYQWRPELLWTHVMSDAVIALAYFSIPITLLYFLSKRKGLKLWWVIALFASFIVLCGATHVMGIYTVWEPAYGLSAGVKLATAVVSIATATAIVPLVPKALTLRTAQELEAANHALQQEIARRAQAEEALATKVTQLSQSNRELEQFAYVASHDLQAPLRSIVSFSSLLEKDCKGKVSEEADQCLQYIQSSGAHMQQLIRDLLELSKVGSAEAKPEEVRLADLVEKVTAVLSADLNSKGAEVVVEGAESPLLHVDRSQVQQLMQNLISNAIKFQRPGVKPRVEIVSKQSEDQCHIIVRDNGIGIQPDQREKIFDIFQRLHGQSDYEGTGIGLSICRKVVEGHGGIIWVESEEGVGSEFHFTLPLAKTDTEDAGARRQQAKTILAAG